MQKMTKKEFLELHKNGKLSLIQSLFNWDKEKVKDKIIKMNQIFIGKDTIRCSINDNGEIEKIQIYKETINNQEFIFVEHLIDNSKSKDCSWDDVQTNTVLYLIK